ncbi:MAG: hypothetical protein NZL92_00700 [Gloeomargarita sp. SKYG116]|nr:hypothetical protein [Gloeomargarita sp. SKYG116]MCS7293004.1 hypothetical protein [Gloeomargarita sp. SKYB120]MDW8178569.1 hypothetical protein [Gloeomargarita sp. SKYBB_i_bin120]MDW8400195.1 hypothetical protein [Gloeomargarita sp. SKYGB_i_bin116]
MTWVALGLLAMMTFLLVWHYVRPVSRTPWWLLWLVLMLPGLVVGWWVYLYGHQRPLPSVLVAGPFILSGLLYLLLMQQNGRLQSIIPSSLTPSLWQPEDLAGLRQCFPSDVYALQRLEPQGDIVICRGRLRMDAAQAYRVVQQQVEARWGQRFWLLLECLSNHQPVFMVIPRQPVRPSTSVWFIGTASWGLGIVLLGIMPAPWPKVEPILYTAGMVSILLAREIGQRWVLRRYGVPVAWPWCLPLLFWPGVVGTYSQMQALLPHRQAAVDRTLAGVAGSLAVALPLLAWGLAHSHWASGGLSPEYSLLLWGMCRLVWGREWPLDMGLHLHPLAAAALTGLGLVALQLVPVGRLDGGRLLQGLLGRRAAGMGGWVAKGLLLLVAWRLQPWLWGWAILLCFIPTLPPPVLNDLTEPNHWRDGFAIATWGLALAIILPAPFGGAMPGW